jgi:hypothetical protein
MKVAETISVPHAEETSTICGILDDVPVEDQLPAYTTGKFLDDQRWLLQQLNPTGPFEDRVEHLDGWYLVLHPETTRLDEREARAVFQIRFGAGQETRRFERFLATSRFLDAHRVDIVRSGLSERDDPLTVREELVSYLIARHTRPGEAIPECALTRFIDEWGLRWS